jgi:hypothetical protein
VTKGEAVADALAGSVWVANGVSVAASTEVSLLLDPPPAIDPILLMTISANTARIGPFISHRSRQKR